MKNITERKREILIKHLNSSNAIMQKKKLSIKQGISQDNISLDKRTNSFKKTYNHRSYFLNLLKQRVLRKKNLKEEITYEQLIELLSKDPSTRTNTEVKEIGLNLSKYYKFFKEIKEEYGFPKLDKVINICHLKKYINDDIIINYEEKQDKVFLLLEGNLGLYKPKFVEKMMTPVEFLEVLNYIENKENNHSKFNRVKQKNEENSVDFSLYERMNNNDPIMNQKIYVFLEEYVKIDEYSAGQIFGAKLNDKKNNLYDVSHFSIKSEQNSILIYFDIDEYRKISKKFEQKKFKIEIEKFKNEFPFYKYFTDDKIISILKILSTKTIFKDEYLYKQNDISDNVYFVTQGKFNMYSSISFNWLTEYLDYIKDSKTNIIYHLIKRMPKNKEEYNTLIEELKTNAIKSPMTKRFISHIEKINEKEKEKSIFGVKNEEENLNDSKTLFKLNIKNIKKGDMVGIEDSIEFKNRYCSVKCVSDIAEVKYISIYDLIKVIKIYNGDNNYMNNHLLEFISKIKIMLYQQIIKDLRHLEKKLTFEFDTKYNDLINPNNESKSNKEQDRTIAAIKVKGFKYDIKEVFDKSIPIFPDYKRPTSENYFLKNQLILKNLMGSPKKKDKRTLKFRQKTSKPLLYLDERNTFFFNSEKINRAISNTERIEKTLSYNNYLTEKTMRKCDNSMSTNFTYSINNLKTIGEKRKGRKMKLSYTNILKNKAIQNYLASPESLKRKKKNYLNYNKTTMNNLIIFNSSPSYETNKKSRNFFLKDNKSIDTNNKSDSIYIDKKKYQSLKYINNDKRINAECIEFILSEKFSKANKKYYLGNQFKNKLDKEKKKFNLIHYKQYFNKF